MAARSGPAMLPPIKRSHFTVDPDSECFSSKQVFELKFATTLVPIALVPSIPPLSCDRFAEFFECHIVLQNSVLIMV
jgi:hypothetical protein